MIPAKVLTDPAKLLKCLSPHITANGGLLESGADILFDLIEKCGVKLLPKSMVIAILLNTSPSVLLTLCQNGCWSVLWKWLQEGIKTTNNALLIEILKVYKRVPATMDLITRNECPRTINNIARDGNGEIQSAAKDVVRQWKTVVRDAGSHKKDANKVKSTSQKSLSENEKKPKRADNSAASGERSQSGDDKDKVSRRSTVKIPPSHTRTAGVEDGNPKADLKSRAEVLQAKTNKPKSDSAAVPIESYHQSVKVTPTVEKRKVVELKESSGFMDSLTTSAVTKGPIKKKRRLSKSTDETPTIQKDAPEEKSDADGGQTALKSSLADVDTLLSMNKMKKSVSWTEEEKLCEYHYFELDETERVNVNRYTMEELIRMEHSMEKKNLSHVKWNASDSVPAESTGSSNWVRPLLVEGWNTRTMQRGSKSLERSIQEEREKNVLKVLYLLKESIPDSPAEPDQSVDPPDAAEEPFIIPLIDLSQVEPTPIPAPIPTPTPAPRDAEKPIILTSQQNNGQTQVSLNPELANLLKTLANSIQQTGTSTSTASPTPQTALPVGSGVSPIKRQWNMEGSSPVDKELNRAQLELQLRYYYPGMNYDNLTIEQLRELVAPFQEEISASQSGMPPRFFAAAPPMMRPPGNFPPGPFQSPQPRWGPSQPRGQVCRFFLTGQVCPHGSQCKFLHSAPPATGRPPRPSYRGRV